MKLKDLLYLRGLTTFLKFLTFWTIIGIIVTPWWVGIILIIKYLL